MSKSSAIFVTIPNEFRPDQKYDGLLGWFCAGEASSAALDRYLKSAAPADGQYFISTLKNAFFASYDYSIFFWLTPSDLKRKRLQIPYLLQIMSRHQLLPRLVEILQARVPVCVAHSDLAELWQIATMLNDLGEYALAVKVFRQGRDGCCNLVKNSETFVIYDWLFAATAYWHYLKLEDAHRCLERARAMVEPETHAEFDEVERRIKQYPDLVPWINRDHLILATNPENISGRTAKE